MGFLWVFYRFYVVIFLFSSDIHGDMNIIQSNFEQHPVQHQVVRSWTMSSRILQHGWMNWTWKRWVGMGGDDQVGISPKEP